jgi:hypothetical protein
MGLVGAVAVVDMRTGDVTEIGTVGSNPAAPTVDGNSVFVYNAEDRTISIVNAASGEISDPVPIPDIETEGISVGFGSVWVRGLQRGHPLPARAAQGRSWPARSSRC